MDPSHKVRQQKARLALQDFHHLARLEPKRRLRCARSSVGQATIRIERV